MGVQGLWDLLAPVGRRVSVETLSGKRVAIDASIWMIQFMKAMRDEKGEMVRNAHLLGFFRRICKLLFLRTKPVFVFDGGTPALKRRTVIARRKQRDNAQMKIRKTAEKLLQNQFKQMRLKELAKELEEQRIKKNSKGKDVLVSEAGPAEKNDARAECLNQENVDEMLAASLAAEERYMHDTGASTPFRTLHGQDGGPSTSAFANLLDDVEDDEDEDDEEMILPLTNGNIDPTVLAALPPSMQLDLLAQMRERLMAENRQKYQKVKKAPQQFSELQVETYLKTVAFRREIDEVQKAASGNGIGGLKTARIASEGNKEFIFSSSFTGDKDSLASAGMKRASENQDGDELEHSFTPTTTRESSVAPSNVSVPSGNEAPPSVNETRERLYRDARRRWRDSKLRAMSLALIRDTNSEGGTYIPLSRTAENQDASLKHFLASRTTPDSAVRPSTVSAPSGNETREDFGSDVHTYRDERGHMRVSRVRAMGIRMTRDLQRNLDLLKEKEQDMSSADVPVNVPVNLPEQDLGNIREKLENFSVVSGEKSSLTIEKNDKNRHAINVETSLEISFEDDGQCIPVDDDDFFAHLVAVDPIPISSVGDTLSKDDNLESESDVEWEDGNIGMQIDEAKSAVKESQLVESNDDETEFQWEDGISKAPEDASLCPVVSIQTKSRGSNEEEAALQEAIKRSLEDLKGEMDASNNLKRENKVIHFMSEAPPSQSNESIQTKSRCPNKEEAASREFVKRSLEDLKGKMDVSINSKRENKAIHLVFEAPLDQNNEIDVPKNSSIDSSISGTGLLVDMDKDKPPVIVCSSDKMPLPSEVVCQNIDTDIDIPCENRGPSDVESFVEHGISISGESANIQLSATGRTTEKSQGHSILHSHITNINEASDVVINLEKSKDTASNAGINRMASEEELIHGVDEREHYLGPRETEDDIEAAGARLEDELQFLDDEYAGLEDEQRKLERNAASVNSEMFVECQELLQMFGIPYIIAPMEAEAQCAYMELAGLVDGVVTDDSDVFLFGARSVYKNIFDDRKYVEAYLMKDIENELGLNREKLIRIALLLGSDYTEGVSGIGIVNAIEVLNAFPEEDGLSKFREWIESPDPSILGKSGMKRGSSSKKKGSKSSETSTDISKDGQDAISSDFDDNEKTKDKDELENIPKITQIFMNKHRKVSKNWHIPYSFPSQTVISAYDSPQVDKSTDPCSWGRPDLSVLRRLCWEKFGWASPKADEVLLPVLKEYNKHETQLRLEAFYTFNERFAKIRSKRVKQAVNGITGKQSVESNNEPKVAGNRNKRKKPTKDPVFEKESLPNIPEQPRKRKAQTGGRKKKKVTTEIELSDTDTTDDEHELQSEEVQAPDTVRRSMRPRKAAKYTESDDEANQKTQPVCVATEEEKLSEMQQKKKQLHSTRPRKAGKYKESNNEANQTTHPVCDATEKEKLKDQSSDKDNSACFSEMGQYSAKDSVPDESVCGDHLFNDGGFCADEDEPEKLKDQSFDKDNFACFSGMGQYSAKDSVPDESACGDYLFNGGGFCADEDEPENEIGKVQNDSAHVDGDSHYIESGGGFCLDDSQTDQCSNVSGSQQQHQQPQNVTGSGTAISEAKVSSSSPMKGLSAMPNLRRKRKKNS